MYIGQNKSNFVQKQNQYIFPFFIDEGKLIVKNILTRREKFQAYYLRHKIFCDELKWVKPSYNKLEIDHYDSKSTHMGVFNSGHKLLAFLRIIKAKETIMIEKEFSFLIDPSVKIRKEPDTIELSRLCIDPETRNSNSGNFGNYSISLLLYKGVYHWCMKEKVRYVYLVIKQEFFRLLLKQGFPFKMIGRPVIMPDGVNTLAAVMDWQEFELLNAANKPNMFKWFIEYQSSHFQ
ncbi:MAG: acyl-homoserine-lactone synthase [bacterium]